MLGGGLELLAWGRSAGFQEANNQVTDKKGNKANAGRYWGYSKHRLWVNLYDILNDIVHIVTALLLTSSFKASVYLTPTLAVWLGTNTCRGAKCYFCVMTIYRIPHVLSLKDQHQGHARQFLITNRTVTLLNL